MPVTPELFRPDPQVRGVGTETVMWEKEVRDEREREREGIFALSLKALNACGTLISFSERGKGGGGEIGGGGERGERARERG